jgi:hypothetical protein
MTPKNGSMKMSKSATEEYVKVTKKRYRAMKSKRAKGRVLDEFCESSGYDRKHAIKLLNGKAGNRQERAGRKAVYSNDVKVVLKELWTMSDQMCSKLLKPVMDLYLESYERNFDIVPDEVREKVLSISPATIDRLLQSERVGTSKWRRRVGRSSTKLKKAVPLRVSGWDVDEPGWLEADGVAHCGGSMAGNFIWSTTYKDIDSCWTEARAVWNRSSEDVKENTRRLEEDLPFRIQGLDVDNGPEFLNWTLYRFCRKRKNPIELTRSRPYHKNDNAHVEQRNWTHVRQLLGYDRLEDPKMVELINDLYVNEWSLFKNLYCPTMKLISKERIGSKYRKKFDKPKTPCQRLLDSEHVQALQKQKLRKMLKETDPYTLKQAIEKKLRKIMNYEQKAIQRRAS